MQEQSYLLASGGHVRLDPGQIEVISADGLSLKTIPVQSITFAARREQRVSMRLVPAETVTFDFVSLDAAAAVEAWLAPQVVPPKRSHRTLVWIVGVFFGLLILGAIASAFDSKSTPSASAPKATVQIVPPTATISVAVAKARYNPDVDIRDVVKNVDRYKGQMLVFQGKVLTIFVDDSQKATQIQVEVTTPSGTEPIIVVYAGTTASDGIYKGDSVLVWVRPVKMQTFKNGFGADVSQPLCAGDYIQKN